MQVLILIFQLNWVYRLYEEYIKSIKIFIELYYENINVTIKFYDLENQEINNLLLDNFIFYNKIFYSGSLNFLSKIYYCLKNKNKLFYINIEQLSHPSYYKLFRTIDTNINIIDYSEENINYLKGIYKNFLLPPFFKYKEINYNNKIIDILSICNNEYRKNIFNNINFINPKNLNIQIIDNSFGNDRDELFDKTKIYINIHGSDNHLTMELIRIVNLIFKKVIIISQKSIYSDILFLKKYIIICNNPLNIENYVNEILNNYEFYFNKIYNNFSENEYIYYIKNNLDKILI
jgi:hypothetical protein